MTALADHRAEAALRVAGLRRRQLQLLELLGDPATPPGMLQPLGRMVLILEEVAAGWRALAAGSAPRGQLRQLVRAWGAAVAPPT